MASEWLDTATAQVRGSNEPEADSFLRASTLDDYRRFLGRAYGFIAPVERTLLDTSGLDLHLDLRRLRKHLLIEHDLRTLGLALVDVQDLPQCMWIPLIDDPHVALGWASVIERTTLAHPRLYQHLATILPGEAAFAASFLKCYAGGTAEMWNGFRASLDVVARDPASVERVISGANAGHRHLRRWRNVFEGKATSSSPALLMDVEATANRDHDTEPDPDLGSQ